MVVRVIDPLARLYVHTVQVETSLGRTGSGDEQFAAPVPVLGLLEGARRLIRGGGGEQVAETSTFYAPTSTAALFAPGSRVLLPGSADPARVLACNVNDLGPGFPQHVEVHLE